MTGGTAVTDVDERGRAVDLAALASSVDQATSVSTRGGFGGLGEWCPLLHTRGGGGGPCGPS
uniref:Uncharacterized protein n=1 Tax=Leersia perrieri TaxID=77586 RepID=A0A0D9UWK4_9ORYZ